MKVTNRMVATIFALFLPTLAGAQVKMTRHIEADGLFMIPELGAVVLQNKDTLRVDMMPPVDQRPKEYASVELREGDLILMFNGKRTSTSAALESAYHALNVGDQIQLGIKRKDGLHLVTFKKADESTLPKREVRMVIGDDKGDKGGTKIATGNHALKIQGEDALVVASAGMALAKKDGRTIVAALIPLPDVKFIDGQFAIGDVIEKVNDSTVASPREIQTIIGGLNDGDTVKVSLRRGDQKIVVSFIRTAAGAKMILKSK